MPLQLGPLDASRLSPVVARVVGPAVQGPAKVMAARGLVPMGPRDLLTVLYQLSFDADAKIKEMAKGTAGGLPDNILAAALGEALDPGILHFYSEFILDRPPLLEKLLLNRATHDDTYVWLAARLGERELEMLANNQERLLACPAIIERIYFNKQARMSTVERLLEMAVRNGLSLDRIPAFKEIAASILGATAPKAKTQAELAAMDAAFAAEVVDEGEVGDMELGEGEEEEAGRRRERSFAEKLRLAEIGTAAVRKELMRDPNRAVSRAAAESKSVTEQEACSYAKNPSLPEDIIRIISDRKEFHKSYNFKKALVSNPKCPLRTSMHWLPHLRPQDLREIANSKSIPSTLAQAAKQMMRKKS
jgi:hypothetical protein